jgi:hypothetical protein
VAQADSTALGGDYPAAHWGKDEVFDDAYTLSLPPGLQPARYDVFLGLYHSMTGARINATVDGVAVPDHAIAVGSVAVPPGSPPAP